MQKTKLTFHGQNLVTLEGTHDAIVLEGTTYVALTSVTDAGTPEAKPEKMKTSVAKPTPVAAEAPDESDDADVVDDVPAPAPPKKASIAKAAPAVPTKKAAPAVAAPAPKKAAKPAPEPEPEPDPEEGEMALISEEDYPNLEIGQSVIAILKSEGDKQWEATVVGYKPVKGLKEQQFHIHFAEDKTTDYLRDGDVIYGTVPEATE